MVQEKLFITGDNSPGSPASSEPLRLVKDTPPNSLTDSVIVLQLLARIGDGGENQPEQPAQPAKQLLDGAPLPLAALTPPEQPSEPPVEPAIAPEPQKEKRSKRIEALEPKSEPTPVIFLQIDTKGAVTQCHTISGPVKRKVPFFQTCGVSSQMADCFGINFDQILKNISSGSALTGEILDLKHNKYEFRAWSEGEGKIGLFLGLKLPEARSEIAKLVEELQHDIKTEINIIKTNADYFGLTERLQGDQKVEAQAKLPRKMQTISSAAMKVGKIMDFYLNNFFSDHRLNIVEHDRGKLESFIRGFIEPIILDSADKEGVDPTINVDFEGFTVPIWTDLVHFTHIFQNLLSNAQRHRNGKKIDICLSTTEEELVLTVRDYGEGIPPEKKKKLFLERFEKREDGSTGLGLMAVQSHLIAINGTCVCESEVGEGTTFIVRIPNKKKG